MSYNPNQHPEGGEVVAVNIDGKMYINPANRAYLEQLKTPKSLKKIKSDTTSHTGFKSSKVINNDEKSEREQQLDRLAILQNTEARLVKDLNRTRKVIASIQQSLEDLD